MKLYSSVLFLFLFFYIPIHCMERDKQKQQIQQNIQAQEPLYDISSRLKAAEKFAPKQQTPTISPGEAVKLAQEMELISLDVRHEINGEDRKLWEACQINDSATAMLALKNGASAKIRNPSNKTPLYFAVWNNNTPLTTLLLECGGALFPDLLIPPALTHKNSNVCLLLSQYARNLTKNDLISILLAGPESETARIAQYFILGGAKVDDQALLIAIPKAAVSKEHRAVVHMLLDPDPDAAFSEFNGRVRTRANLEAVDGDGYTPLIVAIKYDYFIACKILSSGAEINTRDKKGASALWHACYRNDVKMALYLLDKGADTNVSAVPPRQSLQLENQNGSDSIPLTNEFWTSILLAAKYGNRDLVAALIGNIKTDLDVKLASSQQNALHLAVLAGSLECAELLARNRPELNTRDIRGVSPLHIACSNRQFKAIAKMLLDYCDLDPNSPDMNGDTSLHIAVRKGLLETVEALLESKILVDIEKLNKTGESPLKIAETLGLDAIKLKLKEYKGPAIARRQSMSLMSNPLSAIVSLAYSPRSQAASPSRASALNLRIPTGTTPTASPRGGRDPIMTTSSDTSLTKPLTGSAPSLGSPKTASNPNVSSPKGLRTGINDEPV